MKPSDSRRVVITGLGVISPIGNTPLELIESLRAGRSGIASLTQIPTGVLPIDHGAEVNTFTGAIEDYGPLPKDLQRTIRKGTKLMCREIEMGVAAAQRALHDSGLTPENRDRDRTGVIYGCDYIMTLPEEFAAGIKACLNGEHKFHFEQWADKGLPEVNPLWLLKYLPNMPASHVAIYNDLRGPNNSITLREASPAAVLSEAFSTISRGHADVLVVGATGSRIHTFRSMHAAMQETLAPTTSDVTQTSRPFDKQRQGAVLGEGAAAMILETYEHATARGATILGEIVGSGSSTVSSTSGPGFYRTALANSMRMATRGSDLATVGHINAHGLGTIDCDAQESAAITDVFEQANPDIPVSSAKGHFGNLGAGGGMVEIIASIQSLGSTLFPTRNCDDLASECRIRVVTDNATAAGNSFVSVNVTPQGQASAVHIAALA
ncbi:MAG: beta-ketoacyl-[acyl-carrier-protein] synthase family protein [Planctomycetaceae bacterium]